MNLRDLPVSKRRTVVENELNVQLSNIGSFTLDASVASTRNCENMIGAAQIPIGIAGPVNGKYIPLATTEGALVASVNRGCKAITLSGGVVTDSYRAGATRGPVFKVKNLAESDKLNRFLQDHFKELQAVAAKTSRHLTLTSYMDRGVGRYRYVRFVFNTEDAMGMNMVTIATDAIVSYIHKKTNISCVSLAGNYDVDKKASWLNSIEGRGFKVWAEAVLSHKALQSILKTTAAKMYETWLAKCMVGSAMSGSMGFNAHYANVLAALYIATGQDPAHVSEGSIGITTTEVQGKSLYVSVYLPDVMVGVVGGGTGLATQQEALSILKVKNSQEFAEAVGLAALAGEISLLSSLSVGSLAQAHETYGRHR